ncbi:MAG: hypothetical protein ACLGHL_09990 [Actinomycetota bacterium]
MRCIDAGAASCGGHVKGENEAEFKSNLLKHLAEKHGVSEPNDTLLDYLMGVATTSDSGKRSLKI